VEHEMRFLYGFYIDAASIKASQEYSFTRVARTKTHSGLWGDSLRSSDLSNNEGERGMLMIKQGVFKRRHFKYRNSQESG
jgi:hypothetical protein